MADQPVTGGQTAADLNFTAPDLHHLQAAKGWLELGNHLEANEELERITPLLHTHPLVLVLRWKVYAAAKKWDMCVELATALTRLCPQEERGWINLGNSLHFCGRTQEAYDCVTAILDRFPDCAALRYNLAFYAWRLGKPEETQLWLEEAFRLAKEQKLKPAAVTDPPSGGV